MSVAITYMYTIQVIGADAIASLAGVSQAAASTTTAFDKFSAVVEKINKGVTAFDKFNATAQSFAKKLNNAVQPGVELDTSLSALSATTGITGDGLKEVEGYARDTAKTFGGSAAGNVDVYNTLISDLGQELAKTPKAMAMMGDSVATMSKIMGGDAKLATGMLTTVMNAFQVSLDDPIAAAHTMSDMMNTMAAAAKMGSVGLPEIKAALEQSGMAAKTAGVSFAETNAAIQVLDKAGKKGSDAGLALSGVMNTLSQGQFLPPDVVLELSTAGINIDSLADRSLSLSERLKPLQGVMDNSALITKLFGEESSGAAMALLSGLDTMDTYMSGIQGVSVASEQAGVVMDSYSEKISRQKARIDDLRIGLFNFTEGLLPYVQGVVTFFQGTANVMAGVNAIATFAEKVWEKAIKSRTKAITNGLIPISNTSGAMILYNGATLAATPLTYSFATALKAVGKAIYSIPIIGWIAAGISLVVTVFGILWEKCEGFRRGIYAVFEVVKAVFYNIGVVVQAVWENVLKPCIMFWWDLTKIIAEGIWSAMSWCWEKISAGMVAVGEFFSTAWNWIADTCNNVGMFISEVFSSITESIKGVFTSAWNVILGVADSIVGAMSWCWDTILEGLSVVGEFFSGVWNGITDVCDTVATFISDVFSSAVESIKGVFTSVWNVILGVADSIIGAMSWCWDTVMGGFSVVGEFLSGIWNGITDVCNTVATFISDIFLSVTEFIKGAFTSVWNVILGVVDSIVGAMSWCWDSIIGGLSAVGDFFSNIWNWISESCTNVVAFISDAFSSVADTIKEVFAPVWDFVSNIFDKIMGSVNKFFNWVGGLWDKIFPEDKLKNLNEAAELGLAKGSESWRKDQEQKKNKGGDLFNVEIPGVEKPAAEAPRAQPPVAKMLESSASKDGASSGKTSPVIFKAFEGRGKAVKTTADSKMKPSAMATGETAAAASKSEVVNLNNIKGTTDYAAIVSKLAPVKISGLAGNQSTPSSTLAATSAISAISATSVTSATPAGDTFTLSPMTAGTNPAKPENTGGVTGYLREISFNVTSIAAGVTMLFGVATATLQAMRMPPSAPAAGMETGIGLPDVNVSSGDGETARGDIRMFGDMSGQGGAQNTFGKFCENVIINLPAGTPQENVDYIMKELMRKLNDGNYGI